MLALQRSAGNQAVQRLLTAGFGAAHSSILPEEAQRLDDLELFRELQVLGSIIPALPLKDPIREAAIANFHVLVSESLARGVSPYVPGLEFASQEEVERLHARIDLLIVLLQQQLPEFNKPGAALALTVERLRTRQIELLYLLPEEVGAESRRLDAALESVDVIVRAWQAIPRKAPTDWNLLGVWIGVELAVSEAISKLATDDEREAIAKLGAAGNAYLDVMTRMLLSAAAEAQNAMKDPSSLKSEDYGYFTEGFGRDWPRQVEQFGDYVGVMYRLESQVRGLGDVAAMRDAPLEKRIEYLSETGDRVLDALKRVRAVTMVEAAFYLGGRLMEELVDEWQARSSDITIALELKSSIGYLLKALQQKEPPSDALLDGALATLKDTESHVQGRLEELATYRSMIDYLFMIISMFVGGRVFEIVGGGLKAIGLVGGGRAVVRFVLSSLAFTTSATATKSALSMQLPTAEQFGKQAALDVVTLGLLRGTHALVGVAYGAARPVPSWVVHGTTFGTLWAWSSAMALIETKGPLTLESAGETIAHTGARTAIDLAILSTGHGYQTMPPLEGVNVSTAVGRTVVAEWNAIRSRGRTVGEELRTWAETAERDTTQFERIARKGEAVLREARGVYDRLGEAGHLTDAERVELAGQVDTNLNVLRNLSQATRLGIRPTGESSFSYSGDPANVDLYLRRLSSQGLVGTVERVGNTGVLEVRFADGSLRWFAPDAPPEVPAPAWHPGRAPRPAPKPIIDLAAEELSSSMPDVPKPVRALALENLRHLPAGEANQVVLELGKPERAEAVNYLARPDVGTALRAPQPVFNADTLVRMFRDAAVRGQLAPEPANAIQAWGEAWRESVGAGKKPLEDFLSFLRDIKSFHGTLDVGSVAEARRVLAEFGRTAVASPFIPFVPTGPPPPSMGLPSDTVKPKPAAPMEPTPFKSIDDYLIQHGFRQGDFVEAKFDEGTWVVRSEQNAPAQAWRFPKRGFPPDREVDVGALAGLLRTGVANAEAQLKTEPEGARRAMERLRAVYDQLGFIGRIRGGTLGDVAELLHRFEGFARDQALRDWESLRSGDRPYGGKFGRDEFVRRYVEQGLEFDIETRDWRSAAQQPVAKPRFSHDATPTEALDILLGKSTPPAPGGQVADPVQPTFKPYFELLINEGIATRAQVLAELARINPRGKTIDNVRHRLKDAYRPWVVDRMVAPNARQMRARYGDLDNLWDANPGEALQRASHREMIRLTDPLASADKGSLGEEWYNVVKRPAAVPHIAITQANVPAGTIALIQERAADFVEGDAIREVKRVSGALEQRDLDQFKDFLGVVELPNGIELDVGGTPTRVTQAVYVFEVPSGVKANADWMYRQLSRPRRLSFEIFSKSGEMKTITYENRAELLEPALSQWLGLPPTAGP